MRKNKKIAVLLSACFLIGVLSGCGDKTEQKADEDVAQNEVVTESEEKALPWAEQNGLSFQESNDFSIPAYTTSLISPDSTEVDNSLEVKQQNADYSFTTSVITNTDGNDVYTVYVNLTVPFEAKVLNKDSDKFVPAYSATGFLIMDYYTGTVLPARGLLNEDKFELETDVEWEGKTYSLSYSKNQGEVQWSEASWKNDDTITLELFIPQTYTITVPHDYDGLVLGINSKGATSYETDNKTVSDAHIFGEQDDESISDYMFFKVTK